MSLVDPSVDDQKARLRDAARARRRMAMAAAGADAPTRLRDRFVELRAAQGVAAGAVISAFWPMGEEIDVLPLLHGAHDDGFVCALPVVVGRAQPLIFRRWSPGDRLEAGTFGTQHPLSTAPLVRPDVVLAPLLAFDPRGNRIGYGGGYYDRTLAALRRDGGVLAVGVAFAGQQVEAVPHADTDQPLDWIITEAGTTNVMTTNVVTP